MRERRRSPRYAVRDVKGVLLFSLEARLTHAGLEGAVIELTEPVHTGKVYTLTLRHGNQAVVLPSRVAWCRRAEELRSDDGERFSAGLRFDRLPAADAALLRQLFERGADVSFGRRLAARVKLETPSPVDLAAEHEFEVRRISRTGMLVETDLPAELDSVIEVDVGIDGGRLRTRGRVACRIEPSGRAGDETEAQRYRLGVEFLDLTPRDRERLGRFLARLA